MIFAGDFAQLPPVSQTKLFSQAKSTKEAMVFGQLLWRSITMVVMLTEKIRQVGTGNECFVEMLSRLRNGRCTQGDYDLLNTRLLSIVLDDRSQTQWQCVPIIVYTNAIKDAINLEATKTFAKELASRFIGTTQSTHTTGTRLRMKQSAMSSIPCLLIKPVVASRFCLWCWACQS